jgi:hypothetical protein
MDGDPPDVVLSSAMKPLGNRPAGRIPAALLLALFVAGRWGGPHHRGDCRMADAASPAPPAHQHGHHPTDAPSPKPAGCDCTGTHCCPPAAFVSPAAPGGATLVAAVPRAAARPLAAERLPLPVLRGPAAARAPPSLL